MRRTTLCLIAVCAVATTGGTAWAQERTNPFWARPVQPELAERMFPGFAALIGQSGRATLRCWVESDGHPYLCEVVNEAPHGLGFGSSARVMVASAEVGAARLGDKVVGRFIQTTVRFRMEDVNTPYGAWTGPEPSAARLALARELVQTMSEYVPPSYREAMTEGLDFDRREIVQGWIDELMPLDPAREREVMTIQAARLFDETELRRMLAGEQVEQPSEDEFYEACPNPTPEELAVVVELQRRYCSRWECGVDPMG